MAAGSRIAPALLRIQQGTVQIQANLGLAKPTFALLEQINGVSDLGEMDDHIDFEHTNFRSTIKVNNLNFSYPDSNYETISDVSLEIHEGEMIAIVGPSGSGKSTLIDLILGILKPKSGNVLISGIKPSEAIKDWPGAIGYVPQVVNLLNASVKSNLEIGYPTDVIPNERIELALSNAHLSEETIRSNSDIGEHGSKLSGGQRQ
jgi:ABC-type multidrug transport system fused ATPase/permease subunit